MDPEVLTKYGPWVAMAIMFGLYLINTGIPKFFTFLGNIIHRKTELHSKEQDTDIELSIAREDERKQAYIDTQMQMVRLQSEIIEQNRMLLGLLQKILDENFKKISSNQDEVMGYISDILDKVDALTKDTNWIKLEVSRLIDTQLRFMQSERRASSSGNRESDKQ